MPAIPKATKTELGVGRPRLDALPEDAGYLLSVGRVILWIDQVAAEEILIFLEDAIATKWRDRAAQNAE